MIYKNFDLYRRSYGQINRQIHDRAIVNCVHDKISWYNAYCDAYSDNWNIINYIDVWLVGKSIDCMYWLAMLMLFTQLTCLVTWWPSYWTLDLDNQQGFVFSPDVSVYENLWSYVTAFMGKMRQLYLNMKIGGSFCGHAVTSLARSLL